MSTSWVSCSQCQVFFQSPEKASHVRTHCPSCARALNTSAVAEWYYAQGKEKVGPFSVVHLAQLASAGTLRPTDMLWRSGAAKWVPASLVHDIFPSPLTGAQAANTP